VSESVFSRHAGSVARDVAVKNPRVGCSTRSSATVKSNDSEDLSSPGQRHVAGLAFELVNFVLSSGVGDAAVACTTRSKFAER
jgi:hypothetical protein